MRRALITGASSGIGYDIAKIMAEQHKDLLLVSRYIKKLKHVKTELEAAHGVDVHREQKDLFLSWAAKELHIATQRYEVYVLVNNAGVGLKGNFFDDELSKNQFMATINMNSLMEMTHWYGRDMIKQNSGKILNIASITAFFPGPNQPVYYATKAFVRSFSRALAYNFRGKGVSVTVLHPGITRTNFFKAAHAESIKRGASAKSVAELGYHAIMRGDVEVTHRIKNKFLTNVLVRLIPYRLQAVLIDTASDA